MSNLFDLYPGDPRQYDPMIRPYFEAAKRAYPSMVIGDSSSWVLEHNLVASGKLVLAQYPGDENPNPVHHWMFQCDLADLCFHCHKGYGDGICRKHQALYTVLTFIVTFDYQVEEAMIPVNAWLDRHVVVKLTSLLAVALFCCWLLWYMQGVTGYHNLSMLYLGIGLIALIFSAACTVALVTWRQTRRMSGQAENDTSEGE